MGFNEKSWKMTQLTLFETIAESPVLTDYDTYIVAFSGGKDSAAVVLWLLDQGIDKSKIELWHQDVDGREGSTLMDWPCTKAYCKAFAKALGLTIYFSWKEGGFEREMLRDNTATAPTWFETPDGVQMAGGKGKPGTRLKFPQVSADLSVRWCSAYLKIDVSALAIRNQPRFCNSKTLFLSGERAQESVARSRYAMFEPHRSDARTGRTQRHVDHYRPIHQWDESQVWQIMERYRINPHPAYKLGWGRTSCAACIFGSPNQWASLNAVNPNQLRVIADYETQFAHTIQRKLTVTELAAKGTAYTAITPERIKEALNPDWNEPVFLEHWELPAGAYAESTGPI